MMTMVMAPGLRLRNSTSTVDDHTHSDHTTVKKTLEKKKVNSHGKQIGDESGRLKEKKIKSIIQKRKRA